MISTLRRWAARMIALVVTIVTLGMVQVEWNGVGATARGTNERPEIAAPMDSGESDDD